MSDPVSRGEPRINPRYTSFELEVRSSPIHRYGIFTKERIPKGRKIIEYTGQKINRMETKRRADLMGPLNYLFTLDKYWTIDGSIDGSGAEFINHCCDPNVRAQIFKGHILYYSMRDIEAGEELTVDYHFEPDVEKVNCICGSPKCRGTINLPKPPKKPRKAAKGARKKPAEPDHRAVTRHADA